MAIPLYVRSAQGDEARAGLRGEGAPGTVAGPDVQPQCRPPPVPGRLGRLQPLHSERIATASQGQADETVGGQPPSSVREVVEPRGIEPLTFAMPLRRSPS